MTYTYVYTYVVPYDEFSWSACIEGRYTLTNTVNSIIIHYRTMYVAKMDSFCYLHCNIGNRHARLPKFINNFCACMVLITCSKFHWNKYDYWLIYIVSLLLTFTTCSNHFYMCNCLVRMHYKNVIFLLTVLYDTVQWQFSITRTRCKECHAVEKI